MKLPCDRYLVLLFLRGATEAQVWKVLDTLGYDIEAKKASPELLTEFTKHVSELADLVRPAVGNSTLTNDIVVRQRLTLLWSCEEVRNGVQQIVGNTQMRMTLQALLASDFTPEAVRTVLQKSWHLDLKIDVINSYAWAVWYLPGLSDSDVAKAIELHRDGSAIQDLHRRGHPMAMLKLGVKDIGDIDREAELRFMRSSAAIRFREAAVKGRASDMMQFSRIFQIADEMLGPADSINKIVQALSLVRPAMVDLHSVPVGELGSVSGLTGGVAVLSDISLPDYDGKPTDDKASNKSPGGSATH